MSETKPNEHATMVVPDIPGYDYGSPSAAKSPITVADFALIKQTAGFTAEDERWLQIAGEILTRRVGELVAKWRTVIVEHPHLARYLLRPDGQKEFHYGEASGLRFEQWVLDTCLRPYDQDWLDYQQEIALRHTSVKKNKTDEANSVPTIHLRYLLAFNAVVCDPDILKPFLASRGHDTADVERMYRAWMKSLWLQAALWAEPYTNPHRAAGEW